MATSAPASMKGPNGIFDLRPALPMIIRVMPTTPPNRKPEEGPADDLCPAQPAEVEAEDAGELHVAGPMPVG